MNSGNFGTDVKEALKNILLKVLGAIGSRKFWAAFVAILSILTAWHTGSIDAATAIWSIVTTVVTYSGFTALEDASRNKS